MRVWRMIVHSDRPISTAAVCINGAFTLEDVRSLWQNFWYFTNTLEREHYNSHKRLIRMFWPKSVKSLCSFGCVYKTRTHFLSFC